MKRLQQNGSTEDLIVSVTESKTRRGKGCVIIEKIVIKAPESSDLQVGDTVYHYMLESAPSFEEDLKAFIGATYGKRAAWMSKNIIDQAMSPSQPLQGTILRCQASQVPTARGKLWRNVKYGPRLSIGKQPKPVVKGGSWPKTVPSNLPPIPTSIGSSAAQTPTATLDGILIT